MELLSYLFLPPFLFLCFFLSLTFLFLSRCSLPNIFSSFLSAFFFKISFQVSVVGRAETLGLRNAPYITATCLDLRPSLIFNQSASREHGRSTHRKNATLDQKRKQLRNRPTNLTGKHSSNLLFIFNQKEKKKRINPPICHVHVRALVYFKI